MDGFSNSGLSLIRIAMRVVFSIINSNWGTGQCPICGWSASKNKTLVQMYYNFWKKKTWVALICVGVFGSKLIFQQFAGLFDFSPTHTISIPLKIDFSKTNLKIWPTLCPRMPIYAKPTLTFRIFFSIYAGIEKSRNSTYRNTYIEPSFWKVFGYLTCSYHTPAYFANSKSVKTGTSAHFFPHITFCAWVTRKKDKNFITFILENFLWWSFSDIMIIYLGNR